MPSSKSQPSQWPWGHETFAVSPSSGRLPAPWGCPLSERRNHHLWCTLCGLERVSPLQLARKSSCGPQSPSARAGSTSIHTGWPEWLIWLCPHLFHLHVTLQLPISSSRYPHRFLNTWSHIHIYTYTCTHRHIHIRVINLFVPAPSISLHPSTIYSFTSLSLSIHLPAYLSIHLSIHLPIHHLAYPSVSLSIYLPVHLSTYLTIHLPLSLSIYLFTFLPFHWSICPSIYLSIHPVTQHWAFLHPGKLCTLRPLQPFKEVTGDEPSTSGWETSPCPGSSLSGAKHIEIGLFLPR